MGNFFRVTAIWKNLNTQEISWKLWQKSSPLICTFCFGKYKCLEKSGCETKGNSGRGSWGNCIKKKVLLLIKIYQHFRHNRGNCSGGVGFLKGSLLLGHKHIFFYFCIEIHRTKQILVTKMFLETFNRLHEQIKNLKPYAVSYW